MVGPTGPRSCPGARPSLAPCAESQVNGEPEETVLTVDEYLEEVPPERLPALQELRRLCRKHLRRVAPLINEGETMPRGLAILGQVLTAVGATLAAGGIASFFWSKVELRFFGDILSTDRARLLWTIGNLVLALVGLMLLRRTRRIPETTP